MKNIRRKLNKIIVSLVLGLAFFMLCFSVASGVNFASADDEKERWEHLRDGTGEFTGVVTQNWATFYGLTQDDNFNRAVSDGSGNLLCYTAAGKENVIAFSGGDGSRQSPFILKNAYDFTLLYWVTYYSRNTLPVVTETGTSNIFNEYVNSKYYKVVAEDATGGKGGTIDFSAHLWNPIQNSQSVSLSAKSFSVAEFDGNGVTIMGLTTRATSGATAPLFYNLASGLGSGKRNEVVVTESESDVSYSNTGSYIVMKNLIIEKGTSYGTTNPATICGDAYGVIFDNIDIVNSQLVSRHNAVTTAGPSFIARVTNSCFFSDITIDESSFIKILSDLDLTTAGSVSSHSTNTDFRNIVSNNNVYAYHNEDGDNNPGTASGNVNYLGGIFGWLTNTGSNRVITVDNCSFGGEIFVGQRIGRVGGIGGILGGSSSTTSLPQSEYVYKITNCMNLGKITSYQDYAIISSTSGIIPTITYNSGVDPTPRIFMYNCINKGDINITIDSGYLGGIAAQLNSVEIRNCSNQGNINIFKSGTGWSAVGAVIGNITTKCWVDNCYNTGNITSEQSMALAGFLYSSDVANTRITNCYNSGTVRSGGSVAGFVYSIYASVFENCYNSGTVIGAGSGVVTGFANTTYSSVKNCYNIGTVKHLAPYSGSTRQTAGFISTVNTNIPEDITIENCYNAGNVLSDSYTYGFAATAGTYNNANAKKATLINCYNSGEVRSGRNPLSDADIMDDDYFFKPSFFTDGLEIFKQKQEAENPGLELVLNEFAVWEFYYRLFHQLMNTSTTTVPASCHTSITFNYLGIKTSPYNLVEYIFGPGSNEKLAGSINLRLVFTFAGTVGNADLYNCGNTGEFTWNSYGTIYNHNPNLIFNNLMLSGIYNTASGGAQRSLLLYEVKNAIIENCYNTGTMYAHYGYTTVGGIVGRTYDCKIYNCSNLGSIYSEYSYIGDSNNSGTGGIVGVSFSNKKDHTENVIRDCYNAGNMYFLLPEEVRYVGGIIGRVSTVVSTSEGVAAPITIENCINVGNIGLMPGRTIHPTSQYCNMGGILGSLRIAGYIKTASETEDEARAKEYNYIINNCINYGRLTNTTVGGLVGDIIFSDGYSKTRITNSLNFGELNAASAARTQGVIGNYYWSGPSTQVKFDFNVSDCYSFVDAGFNEGTYAAGYSGSATFTSALQIGGAFKVYNGREMPSSLTPYETYFPVCNATPTVGVMVKSGSGAATNPATPVFNYEQIVAKFLGLGNFAVKEGYLNGHPYLVSVMTNKGITLNYNGGKVGNDKTRELTSEEIGLLLGEELNLSFNNTTLPRANLKYFVGFNTKPDGTGYNFVYDPVTRKVTVTVGVANIVSPVSGATMFVGPLHTTLYAMYEYSDVTVNLANTSGTVSSDTDETFANINDTGTSVAVNVKDLLNGDVTININQEDTDFVFLAFEVRLSGNIFDDIYTSSTIQTAVNYVRENINPAFTLPDDFKANLCIKDGKLCVPVTVYGITTYIDIPGINLEEFLTKYVYQRDESGELVNYLTIRCSLGSSEYIYVIQTAKDGEAIGNGVLILGANEVGYFNNEAMFNSLPDKESYEYKFNSFQYLTIKALPDKYYKLVSIRVTVRFGTDDPTVTTYTAGSDDRISELADGTSAISINAEGSSRIYITVAFSRMVYDVNYTVKGSSGKTLPGSLLENLGESGFTGLQINIRYNLIKRPTEIQGYIFKYWVIELADGGTELFSYMPEADVITNATFLDAYLITGNDGAKTVNFTAIFIVQNKVSLAGNWTNLAVLYEHFSLVRLRVTSASEGTTITLTLTQESGEFGTTYSFKSSDMQDYNLLTGAYFTDDSVVLLTATPKIYREITLAQYNYTSENPVNLDFKSSLNGYQLSLKSKDASIVINYGFRNYAVTFIARNQDNNKVTDFNAATAGLVNGANTFTSVQLGTEVSSVSFISPNGYRKVSDSDTGMTKFLIKNKAGTDDELVLPVGVVDEAFLNEYLVGGMITIYVKVIKVYALSFSSNIYDKIQVKQGGVVLNPSEISYFDKNTEIVITLTGMNYYSYYQSGLKDDEQFTNGTLTINLLKDRDFSINFYTLPVTLQVTGAEANKDTVKIGDVITLSTTVKSTHEVKNWKINGVSASKLSNVSYDENSATLTLTVTEEWLNTYGAKMESQIESGFTTMWLAIIVGAPSIILVLLVTLIASIISHAKKARIIREELSAKIAREATFNTGNFIAGLRDNTTKITVSDEDVKKAMKEDKR